MRHALLCLLAAATLATSPTLAAELKLAPNDSFETLLVAQKSRRVTVRLRSGQELTGTVREVSARHVQLGALSGRDFFDAVIALEAIEAVIVRTRD